MNSQHKVRPNIRRCASAHRAWYRRRTAEKGIEVTASGADTRALERTVTRLHALTGGILVPAAQRRMSGMCETTDLSVY
jgi:hypothetical protein